MKNLELENLELINLNHNEMNEIVGGEKRGFWKTLGYYIGEVIEYVASGGKDPIHFS